MNNEKLSSSPYVVILIDLRNMRWARYVVRMNVRKIKTAFFAALKDTLWAFP